MPLQDLQSVFGQLKPQLTLTLALLLESVFQRILSDLDLVVTSVPPDLHKSFWEGLFGCQLSDIPSKSLLGLASHAAESMIENILKRLQVLTNNIYWDTVRKKTIDTRTAGHFVQPSEKGDPPNTFLWKARIPPCTPNWFAKEMVNLVMNTLTTFAIFSQPKHIHCQLSAKKDNRQKQPDLARSPPGTSQCLEVPGTCVPSLFSDTPEGKSEDTRPHRDFSLKEYVQEVGRKITESLKGSLEEQVKRSVMLSIPFSETIAAAQILDSVLPIFSPGQSELPLPLRPPDNILRELLRKSPAYKRDLRLRSQPTLESILKEACKRARGAFPEALVAAKDFQPVAEGVVDTTLKHLCFLLAAEMTSQVFLSAQALCLLRDILAQESIDPSPGMSQAAVPGLRSQIPDFESSEHTILSQRERNFLEAKHILGNCIYHLLVYFLQETSPGQEELPSQAEAGDGSRKGGKEEETPPPSRPQLLMKLCAFKMASAVLTLLQEDLEWAKARAENKMPLEENTSAAAIVAELLAIISDQTAAGEAAVQHSSDLTLCSFTDDENETCGPETPVPSLGNWGSSVSSLADDCASEVREEEEEEEAVPSAKETGQGSVSGSVQDPQGEDEESGSAHPDDLPPPSRLLRLLPVRGLAPSVEVFQKAGCPTSLAAAAAEESLPQIANCFLKRGSFSYERSGK
uniref:Uncharacterized protein n=1 Tax=Sphaerodactylus townsendi TaxID=933632 RepID=A0ACB8ECW3_9SAUR